MVGKKFPIIVLYIIVFLIIVYQTGGWQAKNIYFFNFLQMGENVRLKSRTMPGFE